MDSSRILRFWKYVGRLNMKKKRTLQKDKILNIIETNALNTTTNLEQKEKNDSVNDKEDQDWRPRSIIVTKESKLEKT